MAINYVLTSVTLVDNTPAGSTNGNIILYTLIDDTGAIQPNQYIQFTVTGNAILSVPYGSTNASGQFILTVTNPVSEPVLVSATTLTTPSVTNYTQLTFSAAAVSYVLTSTIQSNNARADGSEQNILQLKLTNRDTGQGVAGRLLAITTNSSATYPSTVVTSSDGSAYVAFSSSVAGNITVTSFLQTDPDVNSVIILTFVPAYPVFLGAHNVYLSGYIGIHVFMAPFQIIVNHRYNIRISRTQSNIVTCTTNYAANLNNVCALNVGRFYNFLDFSFDNVVALASGAGSQLTSQVRYYYSGNNIGNGLVEVYDYGPYYSEGLTGGLTETFSPAYSNNPDPHPHHEAIEQCSSCGYDADNPAEPDNAVEFDPPEGSAGSVTP